MAGKAKKKLDYAGWSVDIFDNDTKIDKLLDAQDYKGFVVYFYLCQRAYGSDGYFYRWSYDDCASTARKMGCGIGSGTIREVVGYCLQIGLFHKGLFEKWGVLTSRGIQKGYWVVASTRRDKTVYKELWLLNSEESKGVVLVPFFEEVSDTDRHSQATNGDKSATNKTVVKESKVKGNKDTIVAPRREAATFSSDSFEMQCVNMLITSVLNQMPGAKVPETDKEKQKWAVEIERMQRIDKRSQEQIMQALKYAVNNPFWQSVVRSTGKFREKFETLYLQSSGNKGNGNSKQPQNQFHNFEQRDTDYNALVMQRLNERLKREGGKTDGG